MKTAAFRKLASSFELNPTLCLVKDCPLTGLLTKKGKTHDDQDIVGFFNNNLLSNLVQYNVRL